MLHVGKDPTYPRSTGGSRQEPCQTSAVESAGDGNDPNTFSGGQQGIRPQGVVDPSSEVTLGWGAEADEVHYSP